MIRRPPRSTLSSSSAASDVYKRQYQRRVRGLPGHHTYHLAQQRDDGGQGLWRQPSLRGLRGEKVRAAPHLCLSLIHISEPTRLLSISYAVFCLKKKKKKKNPTSKKQITQTKKKKR
eukprot:TRINITY_DN2489_c0_g1_i5.p1 TRINITY_DN2489_c0_g1~~TRINITY_DN2489_c0_g1_i5.p1  ORF type:complete len:117 (-),score=38.99 TRINITY_DN2489_c0_g1_i5:104-454(-)